MSGDGGPAFPSVWMDRDSCGELVPREQYAGMTLRDWFAGQALAALFQTTPTDNPYLGNPEGRSLEVWVASAAYDYADAMLRAREADRP